MTAIPVSIPSLSHKQSALFEFVCRLAADERCLRADFIGALIEVEEQRLHLELGHSSLFAFLTERLGFSNASAFRRMTAARLASKMSSILEHLRAGDISLTKLCFLKDVLVPENCAALLQRAKELPEREVQALALSLDPNKAAPSHRDFIRALPAPRPAEMAERVPCEFTSGTEVGADSAQFTSGPEVGEAIQAPLAQGHPSPCPTRHLIRMSVGSGFVDLLERLRGALGHSHPGASLEELFHHAMKVTLAEHERKSRAQVARPRKSGSEDKEVTKAGPSDKDRYVSAAVRRVVWARDESRCTFVGRDGKRCNSMVRLELHHKIAVVEGGENTACNLTVHCKLHNDLEARRLLGDAWMNRFS